MNKRKHIQDSVIMDALDACEYSVHKAAVRVGVTSATMYRWIQKSDNLKKYIAWRLDFDAVKAREKLEFMMENVDCLDPKTMGNVIAICKILLDKAESNKVDTNVTNTITVDSALEDRIKKLLGE